MTNPKSNIPVRMRTEFRQESKTNEKYQKLGMTVIIDTICCYLGYKKFISDYTNHYGIMIEEASNKFRGRYDKLDEEEKKLYSLQGYTGLLLYQKYEQIVTNLQFCFTVLFEDDSLCLALSGLTPDIITKVLDNMTDEQVNSLAYKVNIYSDIEYLSPKASSFMNNKSDDTSIFV